jgi:hypothetical protein
VSSFALNGKLFGSALSADGSELALLRGGVLELFRLPPPPSKAE